MILAIIIVHREERRLKLNLQLNDVDHSSHDKTMLIQSMAEGLIQSSKGLELTINSFMASSNPSLLSFKGCRGMFPWSTSMSVAVAIASICYIHLSRKKRVIQPVASNAAIVPTTTRKRTPQPNNVASLDGDSYLVPYTCMLELPAIEVRAEKRRFLDLEVSAIDRDQGSRSIRTNESITPNYL